MGTATSPVATIETSAIMSTFGSQKPQISNELYAIYGTQFYSPSLMIESLGFESPVAQTTFSHFEEVRKQSTFTNLTGITAQGVGNPISVVLAPDSVDANNNFYPRTWFLVQLPNKLTGIITDINVGTPSAPVLTIVPNGDYDLGAVAAGAKLIITGSAFSEGSDQPKGVITGTTQRFFNTQIQKEAFQVTGTEMTDQKWFDVVPTITGGTKTAMYYVYEQANTEYRLRMGIDTVLLANQPINNTINPIIDPATNAPVLGTEGIFPAITRLGNTLPVTPQQFSVSTFDAMDAILDKNGAGRNICSMIGRPAYIDVQNGLVDYFQNPMIEYATNRTNEQIFKGDKELAASVGFDYFTKTQRTYCFSTQEVFTNPVQLGATNYSWSQTAGYMPIGRMKDKRTKDSIPTFGTRYKALGGYSRKMETWNVSGAGNMTKVITRDLAQFELRVDLGLELIGVNQMIQTVPTTL